MAHTLTERDGFARREHLHRDEDMAGNAVVDERRQYAVYGGMHFGAALYGWLVSAGIGAILMAILGAAGGAVAVSTVQNTSALNAQTVQTVGMVSGILLLLVMAIAYYAGGYVAGRLSRFDGMRQGLATWLVGLAVALLLGGAGAALGAKYNVLQQLNLPHLPVGSSFTTGGLVASILALLITLGAAMLGGKAGEGYHRKIDAEGMVGRV